MKETISSTATAGSASAAFDAIDFTYDDPAKTRIVANGNTISITQGDESLSFTVGTGKLFASNGESVEEFEGLATDGNAVRRWALSYIDPGVASLAHLHITLVEDYFVLQGKGTLRLGNGAIELSPRVYVAVPINTVHGVMNSKDNGPLILIAKCAPSWVFTDHNLITE